MQLTPANPGVKNEFRLEHVNNIAVSELFHSIQPLVRSPATDLSEVASYCYREIFYHFSLITCLFQLSRQPVI